MKQWYYAKAGRQFGPFPKAHVEEMYRKGELADRDLVWEEGAPEWSAAGKAFTVSGGAAAVSPSADISVPAEFHPVDCLTRGWQLTWQHPGHFIGGTFITSLLMNAPGVAANIIVAPCVLLMGIFGETLRSQPVLQGIFFGVLILVSLLAVLIISGACAYPILDGLFWLMLRVIRGATPELSDLFHGFKKPHGWELAKGGMAVTLIMVLGLVCFILPGIYLSLAYCFTPLLIIDQKLPWRAAMKISHQTVRRHFWGLLGFAVLNALLGVAGILCCYVGIFIAMPVSLAAYVYAYEILFSRQPKKRI
ncbi:MAG: GYF domain-containing protein [Verrucomicrobiales bacterium]|jgi:uncharacterized membrane protein|nr:GYF domain-containing protein [Verrucomicrobiales bacterium]